MCHHSEEPVDFLVQPTQGQKIVKEGKKEKKADVNSCWLINND